MDPGGGGVIVVIDIGACDEHDNSLRALAEKYQPTIIFGFDVRKETNVGVREVAGVPCEVERRAAWIHDGIISYSEKGSSTAVGFPGEVVECFDFSLWLADLAITAGPERQIVVKIDAEGAEYPILGKMLDDGTDLLVAEFVIEWHNQDSLRAPYLERLKSPVSEWWM